MRTRMKYITVINIQVLLRVYHGFYQIYYLLDDLRIYVAFLATIPVIKASIIGKSAFQEKILSMSNQEERNILKL